MAYATRDKALRALRHLQGADRFSKAPVLCDDGWYLARTRLGTARNRKHLRLLIRSYKFDFRSAIDGV